MLASRLIINRIYTLHFDIAKIKLMKTLLTYLMSQQLGVSFMYCVKVCIPKSIFFSIPVS